MALQAASGADDEAARVIGADDPAGPRFEELFEPAVAELPAPAQVLGARYNPEPWEIVEALGCGSPAAEAD